MANIIVVTVLLVVIVVDDLVFTIAFSSIASYLPTQVIHVFCGDGRLRGYSFTDEF